MSCRFGISRTRSVKPAPSVPEETIEYWLRISASPGRRLSGESSSSARVAWFGPTNTTYWLFIMGGRITDPTWRRAREGRQPIGPLLERERIVDGIRAFFKARGFNEVETPLLVRHPGMEPHLEVFETGLLTARGQRERAFLTTSPEYAMKKLLAAGLARIFQLCKAFRNREEVSSRHNPEFTILEWYRANAGYRAIMDDCEELLIELRGGEELIYQGERIDLARPWERL